MSLAASCVAIGLLVSGLPEQSPVGAVLIDTRAPAIAASAPVLRPAMVLPKPMTQRPAALPALYVSFGALQVLDAYSTRRAVNRGAVEVNPVMKGFAGNTAAMLAVKSAATAASIYCAEKAWKRNRKAAIVLMAVLNAATAAVAAHNLRTVR